jgi:uncharacterized protein (TIGR03083 family)
MTRTELLDRIRRSWDALQNAILQMSEAQLTTLRSADGWSVQDHLAHLAAWERSTLAILRGEPRHRALGVDAAAYAEEDEDRLNALIYERNRERALADVLADLRDAHAQMLAALDRLSDADLRRPDTDFLPGERGEPLLARIAGNTYEHYDEHLPWISSLVASA